MLLTSCFYSTSDSLELLQFGQIHRGRNFTVWPWLNFAHERPHSARDSLGSRGLGSEARIYLVMVFTM